jgi:glutaredoxin
LLLAALLAVAPAASADEPAPDGPAAAAEPTVVLYMTSWCHYCRLTTAYLRNKGVSFVEKDIEADRDALNDYRDAGGGGGVPMVVIGETSIMGYDTGAIDRALAALPPTHDAPGTQAPETEEPTPTEKSPPGDKWPKTVRGETIDIGGDVHEPQVVFIGTREDVLEEVEATRPQDPIEAVVGSKPDDEEED